MSDKLKLWDLETSTYHLSSKKKTTKCHSDLSSSIWSLFILISFPLHMAWTWVRISDRRVSLMSSNWPRRPALKNIFERRHGVEDQQVQQVQFCWFWTSDSHLCVSKLVLVMVDIQGTQKFLNGLSAVHKRILRNSKRIQNAISGRKEEEKQGSDEWWNTDSVPKRLCIHSPLFEIGIQNAVWKTLSANPDPLKDTVTSQLVEDQEGVNHTWTPTKKSLYWNNYWLKKTHS